MERKLNFHEILSLKEIALRKTIIYLWSERDSLCAIEFYHVSREIYGENLGKWHETVENKIHDKISKLVLPESLAKQISYLVNTIGLQIESWVKFHEIYLDLPPAEFGVNILSKLCWTPAGLVDYCKTAEKLICYEMVDIVRRYKLACLYCLEDYISVFWKKLPEESKREFYNEEEIFLNEKPLMQFCWPYIIKGEKSKLDDMPKVRLYEGDDITYHQYAFVYSVSHYNKAAAKYCFEKLTPEEREAALTRSAISIISSENLQYYGNPNNFLQEDFTSVICYLLSQMTHEQQMQVFKEKPSEILCCFLDWPWQDLFLEIADIICAFLSERDYMSLLYSMHFRSRGSNYYFSKLFRDYFMRSPIDFRKQFVNLEVTLGSPSFINNFYHVQDLGTIEVIFKNIDAADRMRLVSSEHMCQLFHTVILQGKLHIVKVCLRDAMVSKEDRKKLEVAFVNSMPRTYREELGKREVPEEFLPESTLSEEDQKRLEEIYTQSHPSFSMEEFRREIETNRKALKLFFQILEEIQRSS